MRELSSGLVSYTATNSIPGGLSASTPNYFPEGPAPNTITNPDIKLAVVMVGVGGTQKFSS